MRAWTFNRRSLALGGCTYIMGVVNVSPDSFSGDGEASATAAIAHALQLVQEGADILDIGGESSRPGAAPISLAEELGRVLPVVRALAPIATVPLSVDTTKSEVARAALEAGASIINDISAGTADKCMFSTVAEFGSGLVLMHRRGDSKSMGWSTKLQTALPETVVAHEPNAGKSKLNIMDELLPYFELRIAAAEAAGITRDQLCLDAGFGFGKSYEENLDILRHGADLAALGLATLSGTSRKSTIGRALGGNDAQDRAWGTAATVALAIAGGCDVVRVHDVRAMRDVARMTDAVVRELPFTTSE